MASSQLDWLSLAPIAEAGQLGGGSEPYYLGMRSRCYSQSARTVGRLRPAGGLAERLTRAAPVTPSDVAHWIQRSAARTMSSKTWSLRRSIGLISGR